MGPKHKVMAFPGRAAIHTEPVVTYAGNKLPPAARFVYSFKIPLKLI